MTIYLGSAKPCGSGGGGGATVTATNVTGKALTKGDKVWLNKDVRTGGTAFTMPYTSGSSSAMYGFITRSGAMCFSDNTLFSLTGNSATALTTFSATYGAIRYGSDNSTIVSNNDYSYRIDETARFSFNGRYAGEDYFISTTSNTLNKLDMTTGEVIKTYTWPVKISGHDTYKIGNYFYTFMAYNTTKNKKYEIVGDTVVEVGDFTFDNYGSSSNKYFPLGVTADGKYIICNNSATPSTYYTNTASQAGNLRIIEVIDDNHFKMLSSDEMPTDLLSYYSTACHMSFNPYTGILCISQRATQIYAIFKYENGTFNKLPIDISTALTNVVGENYNLYGGLCVSDDLSRLCVGAEKSGSYSKCYIVNLTELDGYVANAYKTPIINQETITGIAAEDAESGGNVTVGVASI